jgi:cytochrome c-type biogenesis protein CcmE
MVTALWIIATLLAVACYLLYLTLSAVLKLISITTVASDMNDENQRRIFSCAKRLHMVEHIVKDIRGKNAFDVEQRVQFMDGDRSQEETIREEYSRP